MQPTNDAFVAGATHGDQETDHETDGRHLEYFYLMDDGRFIYVSGKKYDDLWVSYKLFHGYRLFIGRGEAMQEPEIWDVDRRHEGGTTYISTVEGELFSPPKLVPEARAAWTYKGELDWLTTPDPSGYEIVETDEGVSITKK